MFLNKLIGYLKLLCKLNILKTVYFNLKFFPWHTAIKLPVFFFGPVKFASLRGTVFLDFEDMKTGMIQFGCKQENIISSFEPTRLSIDGELTFKGESKFALATQLLFWKNGQLTFGSNSWVGSFTKIVAFRSIEFGNNFLASWECQIFDTDFHFIENTITGKIQDPNGKVIIGNNVWLGSRVTILKNTFIPDYCIVATGCICNEDYTATCSLGVVLGGIPAKFIKKGVCYVNDKQLEQNLFKYYQQSENYNKVVQKNLL